MDASAVTRLETWNRFSSGRVRHWTEEDLPAPPNEVDGERGVLEADLVRNKEPSALRNRHGMATESLRNEDQPFSRRFGHGPLLLDVGEWHFAELHA